LQKEEYIQHQRELNGVKDQGDVRTWENPAYKTGYEKSSEKASSSNHRSDKVTTGYSQGYPQGHSYSGEQKREKSIVKETPDTAEKKTPTEKQGKEFKPYNLKDYKDIMDLNKIQYKGLGPNINTDQYKMERLKNERRAEFAQQVKIMNAMKLSDPSNKKQPGKEQPKAVSKREKALMFAKNVPKPRPRTEYDEEEDFDFSAKNDLDQYEKQYNDLKSKMEKMKL
jgi:hypothetical protein